MVEHIDYLFINGPTPLAIRQIKFIIHNHVSSCYFVGEGEGEGEGEEKFTLVAFAEVGASVTRVLELQQGPVLPWVYAEGVGHWR